jgi:hypothetical protein
MHPGASRKVEFGSIAVSTSSGRSNATAKGSAAQINNRHAALRASTRPSVPGATLKAVIRPAASFSTNRSSELMVAWVRALVRVTPCVDYFRDGQPSPSKYPPAEPGALRFEPLKAAIAASRVTLVVLTHRKCTASKTACLSPSPHETSIARLAFRVRGSAPSRLASNRVGHQSPQASPLLEMSNCYCHPGRAGGTPIALDF